MHMIGHILFGLVVGIVAKLVFPGHDPRGSIVTILLGMAGAWIGGYLGRALGWYQEGHAAGFLMAVVGALILLCAYHFLFGNKATATHDRTSPVVVAALHIGYGRSHVPAAIGRKAREGWTNRLNEPKGC